jgi:glucose-6-phosphate 1-epimerase
MPSADPSAAREMPRIRLAHPSGSTAEGYLHGAHVTSWVPAGGGAALFVSRAAKLDGQSAIRGGVPVVFPQFADNGPLPKHGFVRTAAWERVDASESRATLRLRDSERTRALWPHAFAAEYTVEVDARRLTMRLRIENTGAEPFEFTAALHTYLRVADVGRASVAGLHGVTYRDKVRGGETYVEEDSELRIDGELDRVYLRPPPEVRVRDVAGGRTFRVRSEGFADTVVWNPGAAGAAKLPDMEAGEAREMLCVEAAQVADPVRLPPGECWIGAQVLEIE